MSLKYEWFVLVTLKYGSSSFHCRSIDEDDVVGVEVARRLEALRGVVPLHALAQMEGVFQAVGRDGPALGETGHDFRASRARTRRGGCRSVWWRRTTCPWCSPPHRSSPDCLRSRKPASSLTQRRRQAPAPPARVAKRAPKTTREFGRVGDMELDSFRFVAARTQAGNDRRGPPPRHSEIFRRGGRLPRARRAAAAAVAPTGNAPWRARIAW